MASKTILAVALALGFAVTAQAQQCSTPNITLPWGTYCSSAFDTTDQIYTFQNVRFGRDTSTRRFLAPLYPNTRTSNKVVESGNSCPQVTTQDASGDQAQCIPGGNILTPGLNQSEDCLFLDIYVPAKVLLDAKIKGIANTPVVVWLFGGAFVFGSKNYLLGGPDNDPLYNGTGILNASPGNVIFVAGNYRLGAFGWLAGTTMQNQGLPNAGLSDQRLLFSWVQDFIHLVGGDKKQVSAWGESAGAGSILHHLISHDPKSSTGALLKPNFTKAAIQSPAYEWQWDPNTLEATFQSYANLSLFPARNCSVTNKCSVGDLQAVSSSKLITANQKLFQTTTPCTGLFPIGPSVDGTIITEISPVALTGKPGQNFSVVDSLIISHCSNEAQGFIPPPLNATANPTEKTWQTFLTEFVPETNASCIRTDINNQYPLSNFKGNYTLRAKQVIQDAVFVCNVRQLFDGYLKAASSTKVYAMEWNFGDIYGVNLAQHATDLPALFYNTHWSFRSFMIGQIKRQEPKWTKTEVDLAADTYVAAFYNSVTGLLPGDSYYQSYWKAHAIYGNPNTNWSGDSPTWHAAGLTSNNDKISNVLQVNDAVWDNRLDDPQTSRSSCQFWTDTAIKVTKILNGSYKCPSSAETDYVVTHDDL